MKLIAPGMWMKKGKTLFISLPGVPYEMVLRNRNHSKVVREYERPYIIHKLF
jgi:nicotinamide-nucleotide amidase